MIEFSNPTVDDSEEIYFLGKPIFDWTFEKISWSHSLVEWFLNNHLEFCFVATHNGSIVGFHLSFIQEEIGYMGWACTSPKFRKLDITNNLVSMTINKMRSISTIEDIYSHVREDGVCDILLKKRGFINIKEKKIEMKFTLRGKTNES